MLEKLKSRKFWFALIGALLPIVAQLLTGEVGWEAALQISGVIIVGYIFGQSYVDAAPAADLTDEPVLAGPTETV